MMTTGSFHRVMERSHARISAVASTRGPQSSRSRVLHTSTRGRNRIPRASPESPTQPSGGTSEDAAWLAVLKDAASDGSTVPPRKIFEALMEAKGAKPKAPDDLLRILAEGNDSDGEGSGRFWKLMFTVCHAVIPLASSPPIAASN